MIDSFKGTLGTFIKTPSISGPGYTGVRIIQSQTQLNIEMAKQGHLADIVDNTTSANAHAVVQNLQHGKILG